MNTYTVAFSFAAPPLAARRVHSAGRCAAAAAPRCAPAPASGRRAVVLFAKKGKDEPEPKKTKDAPEAKKAAPKTDNADNEPAPSAVLSEVDAQRKMMAIRRSRRNYA